MTRRAYFTGNQESVAMWVRPSHPLRVVLGRDFRAKRRRTEAEFAEAAARVVVVRLRGARRAGRWLAGHEPSAGTSAPGRRRFRRPGARG